MTKEEFFKELDQLIMNVDSNTDSIDNLNLDLEEIKSNLVTLKAQRKAIKDGMNEDRYFDAEREMVDRSLVMSLKKQINKLTSQLDSNKTTLNNLIVEEENTHIEMTKLENAINVDTNMIESLEKRINKVNKDGNEEAVKQYKDQLSATKDTLKINKDNYEKISKEYANILKDMDSLSIANEELERQISELNNKLTDTNKTIESKNGYINEELKAIDEEKLKNINKQIDELENKKVTIINNPVFIIQEIKDAVLNDDMVLALNKTKELIANILTIPYMDIDNLNKLTELKASLEQEKIDFISYIDNKNYDEINLDFISDRILYLNNIISNINEEIDFVCKRIARIDSNNNYNENIKKCLDKNESLMTDITLYNNILATEENMSVRRSNQIKGVLNKISEQQKIVDQFINSYKVEQTEQINEIMELEQNKLADLKKKITLIEKEKEQLNKIMTQLKSKNKDILAEESDQEILHEFDQKLRLLSRRIENFISIEALRKDVDNFFNEVARENEIEVTKELEIIAPANEESKEIEIVEPTMDNTLNLEFVDFDENKFLDIPESNVVKIDDIINDNTDVLEPLFTNDEEVVSFTEPIEEKEDTFEFEPVTDFDIPVFESNFNETLNPFEVVDVTPIVSGDNE